MSNLLILGAGQFGLMVKEIAKSTGEYSKIDFLDDKNPLAIGKLDQFSSFVVMYDYAIVAIGNPTVRCSYLDKIRESFNIAIIISPSAYVSKNSKVCEGSIIEPMAVVQTGANVGRGCIVSSGAVLRHNSTVCDYCHIDCNSVVMSNSVVPMYTKVGVCSTFKNDGKDTYNKKMELAIKVPSGGPEPIDGKTYSFDDIM